MAPGARPRQRSTASWSSASASLPLAFNGHDDSIYHPFDRSGNKHMEYVQYRGSFDDMPLERIIADFSRTYPVWLEQGRGTEERQLHGRSRARASEVKVPADDAASDDAPAGFAPLAIGGDFMAHNGPLYVRVADGRAQLGFRVQARHTNPLNNCHGGMLASFGDMLLPVCIHRQSAEVGLRFPPTISLQIDYSRASASGCLGTGRG